MDQDVQGLLSTSAELAVAFVGFASLVGVFLARNSREMPIQVRMGLQSLLDYSLLALLACGAPLLLRMADLDDAVIWSAASGTLVVSTILYVTLSHFYYREVFDEARRGRSVGIWLLLAGDACALLILAGNTVGWPYESSLLAYFSAAVAWNIVGAALSFRGVMIQAWSPEIDQ